MVKLRKISNRTFIALVSLILLYTPVTYGTTQNRQASGQTSVLKSTLPLEQLIGQARKQYGSLVVHSARLTGREQQRTYVINFVDNNRQSMRVVYDAFTGKLLDSASLKAPMPVEKSLSKLQTKFPQLTLIRTWLDHRNGELVRMVELSDAKHKRWEIIMDAYTGQTLNEQTYDIKPSGKEVTLAQVLEHAREKHKGMVVLQTRSTMKNNTRVREITYLDENKIRRKMTVNIVTGEIISDKISSASPI